MLTINGTDYTLVAFLLFSLLALFFLQFFLCRKSKRLFVKCLPMGYVAALLMLSVACLFGDTGGFIDLRSFFALVILGYAAICAGAIGLGWLLGRPRKK